MLKVPPRIVRPERRGMSQRRPVEPDPADAKLRALIAEKKRPLTRAEHQDLRTARAHQRSSVGQDSSN